MWTIGIHRLGRTAGRRLSLPNGSAHHAELWHSDNIYTPCFVLNGDEWQTWLVRHGVPDAGGDDAGVLAVSSTDLNHWNA